MAQVPGSSVGYGLYDHFVSPSGETLFFYHKSSIVCESLQPDKYPRPGLPVNLYNILQVRRGRAERSETSRAELRAAGGALFAVELTLY